MSSWKLLGHLVTSGVDVGRGWVTGDGPVLTGAGAGQGPPAGVTVDAGRQLVVPGFVDLHVHGALGHTFSGATPEEAAAEAREVARAHATHGTTTLLATTVTESPERLEATVTGLGRAVGDPVPGGARIAGIHLEGPWLSPERAGAHQTALLRTPDPAELRRLVTASGGTIRLVTYAPELAGAGDLLTAGLACGIVMSVGHTAADHATVVGAFAAGATHVTHLGNAMPPLDRRAPGPLGAALTATDITVEVIADGVHLDPGFVAMVATLAGGRLVAVTDAVSACGMPAGRYRLGGREIEVAGNRVVVAGQPATLAGSMLTMDRAVAGLVDAGMELAEAIRSATATPAGVLAREDIGHLRAGTAGDLVVLDPTLAAAAVLCGGRPAFDPDGLLASLTAA